MRQLIESTQNSFDGQTIYVGIDCHKLSWKVTILTQETEHKTMSREPNAKSLVGYLRKYFPGAQYKAVYESGFNGFTACRKLRELGIDAHVVHAADVPTTQKDRHQKTDKADSRKLAKMLRANEFESIDIPDKQLELDRSLLRLRQAYSKDLTRIKLRVKSLLSQYGIGIPLELHKGSTTWSKAYLEWLRDLQQDHPALASLLHYHITTGLHLREQIQKLTKQIKELATTDRYRDDVALLTSMPGVGETSAMSLLTQLGDITRFKSRDHLCSYIGLVPRLHSSGEREGIMGLSRRGRKNIKCTLIESAWVATRKDPALMAQFQTLCKRMKRNKAIIRIAKSLINRMRYVLIHRTPYVMGVVA